jgi:hypothetical protein
VPADRLQDAMVMRQIADYFQKAMVEIEHADEEAFIQVGAGARCMVHALRAALAALRAWHLQLASMW